MESSTKNIDHHLLLDSFSEAILILDIDGYFIYANTASIELTGYQPEEITGKHLSFLYEGKDDKTKSEYDLSVVKKEGKLIAEGWRTCKNNTSFWGEMTISRVSGKNGHSGYNVMLRDVSERKERELELRASEERYRLMVEGVRDYAIFMLNPTGHIISWNEGARRTKGYSANEIIGKHFSTFYTTEDLDDKKPERELRIAIATGKYEEEGWRVKKNGSVFWANVVITALYNEYNQLIGFSKVTRDLTERRDNEESLRESEERYRSLVEQVTDYGIFLMDEKGRIISWNEGARKMKGYEADEIIGKYFSIFYLEEDIRNGKPSQELKTALSEGKYEEEGWRLRKDGNRFWASVVITPVYNKERLHIGFSKVTRDLTERKAAEKAQQQSYEQYRQLAHELKKTNTELVYANRELEQYTSIVSHDLQEPVRTIKSFLQLIDMKLEEEQYAGLKAYINKSITAANRMRELIQSLLHYSQLGKVEFVEKTIAVDDLIQRALQNIKTSTEHAGAEITIDNQVLEVTGDDVQLVQLFQNLLSNAVKFTDNTDPKIRIEGKNENGKACFAISDNGIGIAEKDINKVFEIFKKLNTQKEYPGTGIGLAICKKIIDRHKGKIWLESKPGHGTTFYFTLNEQTQTN